MILIGHLMQSSAFPEILVHNLFVFTSVSEFSDCSLRIDCIFPIGTRFPRQSQGRTFLILLVVGSSQTGIHTIIAESVNNFAGANPLFSARSQDS